MYCTDCKEESGEDFVCTNCGLVSEEPNIINYILPKQYRETNNGRVYGGSLIHNLSPDIEFSHKYAKYSSNSNLNRALGRQRQEKIKTEKNFYFRDLKDIQRVCDYLHTPDIVLKEALNIRKQIGKKSDYFKRKTYFKNMACVKVAARIHDFPMNEREFIQLMKSSPLIRKGDTTKLRGNNIKKEIDKRYREIVYKHLKINILLKKRPNFISYAINSLKIPQHEKNVNEIYIKIEKFLNSSWSIKGVILAIIHTLYNKEHKIRIVDLENLFNVNRLTISSRKKDIKKILEKIENGKNS